MEKQIFDLNEFLEEFEDSMDIMESMLPKFEQGIFDSIEKIDSLLLSGDSHGLAEELHSLKGMVGTLYSPLLTHLAQDMEQDAKNSNNDNIPAKLLQFKECFPKVVEAVGNVISKNAS